MFTYLKRKSSFIIISTLSLLASCATISNFDQYSYTQATSLKVDALNTMTNATDSFSLHQADVAQLRLQLSKAYEYEKNKPKNEVTSKMWIILIDSNGTSLGGFLTRWQKDSKLDTAFINQSKILVSQSFDGISGLESGKIKATAIVN
ncbi:MAG TPA: hypothetical protein VFW07_18335 [Parafilimonas sp.]|nr:hypothetical protein [Parafilimonas sp.]